MTKSIVKHGSFTLEAVDETESQVRAMSGNIIIAIEEGDNAFRFLPPLQGDNPFRVTAMHYVDAIPGLDKMLVFACPRHELKQPCLVCEKAQELSRSPNPIDREKANRISAGLRVYANVVPRRGDALEVRVLGFGKQIWDQLKAIRRNPRLGGDFTDPSSNGFDIVISRTGTGKNDTRYTVAADRNNSPLSDDAAEMERLISEQHDLSGIVQPIVPEEIELLWARPRQPQPDANRAPVPPPQGRPPMPRGSGRVVPTTGTAVSDAQSVSDDDFDV